MSVFNWIDRLAGKWFDWRTDRRVKQNPELQEFGLHKAEANERGFYADFITPAAAILADEMATMLEEAHAENYVEFDMMPRLDRGLRPIRVTVQWAGKLSPAQKAAQLAEELAAMTAERDSESRWASQYLAEKNALEAEWGKMKAERDEARERAEELIGLLRRVQPNLRRNLDAAWNHGSLSAPNEYLVVEIEAALRREER